MSARSRIDTVLAVLFALLAALFVPKLFVGEDSTLYTEILTEPIMLYAAAVPKLLALALAAIVAYGCTTCFEPGTPTRRGWVSIAVWIGTWFVAQAVLGSYQLILLEPAPFPSAADALFMVGYPAMIAGFVIVIRAYVATGMVGDGRQLRTTAIIAAVPLFLAGAAILAPMLSEGGDALSIALNVAYPFFDLVALVPTIVLLRITLKLMGGALFWVWALICAGLIFMVAGDLLFGYFELLGLGFLEPLLDLCYIASYTLLARGIYQQYRISRR